MSSRRLVSSGTGESGLPSVRVSERLVDFPRLPQAKEQHGEFASDGDNGPLLAVLASSSSEGKAPAPEIRIWAKGAKDVVGGGDQKAAQLDIAGFGDPKDLSL